MRVRGVESRRGVVNESEGWGSGRGVLNESEGCGEWEGSGE